ncbi:MAG: beta-propeller fold lactonase family protein [Acidobacteria bacterium]|nr:beta-propeller fold lactonase family protein [Acidobacteriota bacterium]MCB9398382.1 beta-propeller fold lactonase family protein [Acidobacteriota bacterium]
MKSIILLGLGMVPVWAGTTYVYSTDTRPYRNCSVHVALANGGGFRALPDGVYPQPEPNGFLEFQHSVTVTDPGPFLYTTHTNPGVIYGYRRFLDGHLELLPNFPYYLPLGPNNLETSPIWLTKHPSKPILYSSNVFNHGISVFQIETNGSFSPTQTLILGELYTGYAPQALALSPDGSNLFVNCYQGDGILSIAVDPVTGELGTPAFAASLPGHGRGLVLSEDGQYLYATVVGGGQVYSFHVQGSSLTPLATPSFPLPNDGIWLFRKGNLIAVGGYETRIIVMYQIGPNGFLSLSPGSPHQTGIDFITIYAAFDEENRMFVGGNGLRSAFSVSPQGQLTPLLGSPLDVGSEAFFGVSVSPEVIGDPYSLDFAGFPRRGDPYLRIQGDPNSLFALQIGDECQADLWTDASGRFVYPSEPLVGTTVQIKAYCSDEAVIREVVFPPRTVPTLSTWGLLALTTLLMTLALCIRRRLA